MKNADPKCQYCLGTGVRHNGYFEYPCSCIHRNIFNILPDAVIDSGLKVAPLEEFELEPVNYKQAWLDLRNEIIDQITDKEDDTLFASDLKSVMDGMIFDYR